MERRLRDVVAWQLASNSRLSCSGVHRPDLFPTARTTSTAGRSSSRLSIWLSPTPIDLPPPRAPFLKKALNESAA